MARASVGWRWAGAVLAALALFAVACVHFVNVTYDDAFISFRCY